ncbi:MAG: SDR family oxidoreductase [Desulfovermiculus sp.]|nr:SDR family oxidoreductase [Desulfovermiculus sp.]
MQLQGRTALVTGAGRGLGRAIASRFAREGAQVIGLARHDEDLKEVKQDILAQGGSFQGIVCDVSQAVEVQQAAELVRKQFGKVDILVNNAAIVGPAQFTEAFDHWRQTLEINLLGPACCVHTFMSLMLDPGTVINITSGLSRMAFPRFSAYCTSKAGLEHLSRCLVAEFGSAGLKVACLDPGVMDTGMQEEIRALGPDQIGQELWNQFSGMKASGQLRDPAQVAELALALTVFIPEERNGESFSMQDLSQLQAQKS